LARAADSAPLEPLLATNLLPEIEAWLARQPSGALEALATRLLARIGDPEVPLLARISAGNALGILGDPRLDPLAPAMCRVPLGRFAMGTDPAEVKSLAHRYGVPEAWFAKSTPRHEPDLDAYEIGRFPVTEGDWARYAREERDAERPPHWRGGAPPRYRSNHPVHSLSWAAIVRYTEWLSERSGIQYRIPTEAEWEKAARGADARAFPWGERFEAARCNTREGGVGSTTPVGIYAAGASPCGALDLAGNVEEWTADLYWPYPGTTHEDPAYGSYRVARGGVFCLDADLARCDRRHGPSDRAVIGFRLARSAANEWG
jgi:formylglycine-generating enzyme required for sulfatase activity